MASIANLFVTLGANTARFETDMKRTAQQQEKRMKKMKADAAAAAKGLAVAFTAATGAMAAVVVQTAKTADSMGKLGQRLGASTEALSELGYVAERSGVDFRTLEMGLQRMTRRIGEVAFLGKGEAKVALETLGLSAKKLAELPLDKQFEAIAEELSKVENSSQRTSLAMKIFDAEGVKLVQLMGEGSAGIQQLREELDKTGAVISGELAAASARFNDNLTLMGKFTEGAKNQFTEGLLPALIEVQEYFLDGAEASEAFARAGAWLGEQIKKLVGVFIVLKHAVEAVIRVFIALIDYIYNAFKAVLAPITASIEQLGKAFDALARGDVKAAMEALGKIAENSGKRFSRSVGQMDNALGEMALAAGHVKKGMDEAVKVMNKAYVATERTAESGMDAAEAYESLGEAAAEAKPKLEAIKKVWEDTEEMLDELIREQQEYEQASQSLVDTLFPLQALERQREQDLQLLARYSVDAQWSTEQYEEAVRRLNQAYDENVKKAGDVMEKTDLLQEAMLEGVRILERSFTSMWENLLSGAEGAFDSIKDGFKSLISNLIHQATTQRIVLNIQQGIQNGFSQQNLQQIGQGIASFAATILGAELGGGGAGATSGAAIGQIAGNIIGSAWGPVGSIIAGAVGAALGGLVGGLFDSDRPAVIEVSGFSLAHLSGSDDDSFVDTIFGRTFLRSRRIDASQLADIQKTIQEFDNSIASFLNDDQIGRITQAVAEWQTKLKGDAATLEEILGSRFQAMLSTFGEGIQTFVNRGMDLADQVDRLQVAVTAQNILDASPDIFGGKTVEDFLSVVEMFRTGTESITDAFTEVLVLLDTVGSALGTLQDFASSNLGEDFRTLLDNANMSLTEALSGMNQALTDAIINFDGSPEQLQNIGLMVQTIREGELKLLSQIDAIQKGLNSSLEKLKADLLGITEAPKTGEQILAEAQGLLEAVAAASAPEEIAALGREFEALIRSLSPEDQAAMQAELVALVEQFQAASNAALEAAKQAAIENAEAMREFVETFLTEIGDPLDIIAASVDPQAGIAQATLIADEVTESLDDNNEKMRDILSSGVNDMTENISEIGPLIAGAIQGGLSGVNIQVNVQLSEEELVNG